MTKPKMSQPCKKDPKRKKRRSATNRTATLSIDTILRTFLLFGVKGLAWADEGKDTFRVSWKHKSTKDWQLQEDAAVITLYSAMKGHYYDHKTECKMKELFRNALNASKKVELVVDHIRPAKSGEDSYRVFRFVQPADQRATIKARELLTEIARNASRNCESMESLDSVASVDASPVTDVPYFGLSDATEFVDPTDVASLSLSANVAQCSPVDAPPNIGVPDLSQSASFLDATALDISRVKSLHPTRRTGVVSSHVSVAAHGCDELSFIDINQIQPMDTSDITDLTPYLSADCDMAEATLHGDIPRHAGESKTGNLPNFGELGVTDNDSPVAAHSHEEMLSAENKDTISPPMNGQMFEELTFDNPTLTTDQLPSTPPRSPPLYDDFLYYYIE